MMRLSRKCLWANSCVKSWFQVLNISKYAWGRGLLCGVYQIGDPAGVKTGSRLNLGPEFDYSDSCMHLGVFCRYPDQLPDGQSLYDDRKYDDTVGDYHQYTAVGPCRYGKCQGHRNAAA